MGTDIVSKGLSGWQLLPLAVSPGRQSQRPKRVIVGPGGARGPRGHGLVSLILQTKDGKSGREAAGGAAWHLVNVGASSENCTGPPTTPGTCRSWGDRSWGRLTFLRLKVKCRRRWGQANGCHNKSPEQAVGKEPGWSLGVEPGEERGWVARHFSGSFAPRRAGQKELPESQCLIAPQISLSGTKWVPWGWEGIGI